MIVDLTNEFEKVPTFDEIEQHIRDIIASGEVFDTFSPEWKIDIKGGNRVVDKLSNHGNFQKLQNPAKKRHNKYVKSIKSLINNARYNHSDKNTKPKEKPDVLNYHYFDVKVKIGEKIYDVSLECEENKNVPSGHYAKRRKTPLRNDNNVKQTNTDVKSKTVHLYNIKELKQPKTFYQSVYHGTPHRFDEFSTDKIGTGEGAQTHGWGLYFAGNKDISEEYRKSLSGDDFDNEKYYYDKQLIEDRNQKAILATVLENGKEKVIQVREKSLDKYKYDSTEYEKKNKN
ncbi:MAG: hypothetical protein LUB59_00380 [Candidatus Gastranaerophilales bacterium]|nr:hypothetical protein [Candidatus Gastranaerophilales bacterium]